MRRRISAAADSVKVTINTSSSDTGSSARSTRSRQRSTSVRVLPAPAAATTSTSPSAVIARSWLGGGSIIGLLGGLLRFAHHTVAVRPRIDAAHGTVIAPIARRLAAFAIRVHRGVAGENAAAHRDELSLNVIEQCGKRTGFEQLAA